VWAADRFSEAVLEWTETAGEVHDLQFDTGPLRASADRVEQCYAGLSERLDTEADDRPEDRMFL